ncbi:MAG: CPBP family intramembrane glutamic endopeptidase [Thermoguttaceae bacterium]
MTAILVTRFVLGERLRTTTINRLGRLRYYFWAWFVAVAGTIAVMLLTVLFGVSQFDFQFTLARNQLNQWLAEGAKVPSFLTPQVFALGGAFLAITIAPFINCFFALGEELGWRGFLLPRLIQTGMGQWKALLLSGAIWGIWHAPAIVQGHNYPLHPYLGVLLMTAFCVLLGIIFGWLRLASGSVWAPTFAHGAFNAVAGLPMLITTPCDWAIGGMLTSLIGWIPLALFIAWLAWTKRLPVQT